MSQQVDEIKSKLNIVDVIADYVQLKKAGVNYRARCPFHNEKSPSFYVSPARQIWHCFGCGLGGDMFEFIKQLEGVDFPEALARLAERAGVRLSAPDFTIAPTQDRKAVLYEINALAAKFYAKVLADSPLSKQARDYLAGRKFTAKTVADWLIGYSPDRWDALFDFLSKKGYQASDIVAAGLAVKRDEAGDRGQYFDRFRDRIMFPIRDGSGRVVGFAGRILNAKEGVGKYINSPESPIYSKSQVLYGFFQARTEIRRQNLAVIVEGNIDVIKSHQVGVTNVVASSGTALTEGQLRRLSPLTKNLTFAFDADSAGVTAARRALDLAIETGFAVRLIQSLAGLKDADEVIDQDPNLWRKLIAEARDFLDFYFHKIFDILPAGDARAKAEAVDNYLSLLARVDSPVVQSHYIHQVAAAVGAKDQIVHDELLKLGKSKTVKPQLQAVSQPSARNPAEVLEMQFLGLLLKTPSHLAFYLSRHTPQDFTIPALRDVYQRLLQFAANRAEQFSLEDFLKNSGDILPAAEMAMFASEIEERSGSERLEELKDLSKRVRLARLHRQRDDLSKQLAQAEADKNEESRRDAITSYNQVLHDINNTENE